MIRSYFIIIILFLISSSIYSTSSIDQIFFDSINKDINNISINSSPLPHNGFGYYINEMCPQTFTSNYEQTNKNLDLAINGKGYFVLSDQSNQKVYSRMGEFNTSGNIIVNPMTGNKLLGWQGIIKNGKTIVNKDTVELSPINPALYKIMKPKRTDNIFLSGNLDCNTPIRIEPVTITFQNDNGSGLQTYSFKIVFHRAHPIQKLYIWRAIDPNKIDNDINDLYNEVLREPPPDPSSHPRIAYRFPNGKPIMGIMELDDNNKVIGMYENIDAPSWTFDPYCGDAGANGIGEGNLFFNEFDRSIDDSAISVLNGVTNSNIRNADNITGNGDGVLTGRELQIINRSRTQSDRLYGRLNWRNQNDWANNTYGDPNITSGPVNSSNYFIIDTSDIDNYTDSNNPEYGYLNTINDIKIYIPDVRIGQGPSTLSFRPDCSDEGAAPDFEADSGNAGNATVKTDIETQKSTNINIYDKVGNPFLIYVTFEKIIDDKWFWLSVNPYDTSELSGYGIIDFSSNGIMVSNTIFESPSHPLTYDKYIDTFQYGSSNLCYGLQLNRIQFIPDFDGDGVYSGVDANSNNIDDGLDAGKEIGTGTDQSNIYPNNYAEYDDYIYDRRSQGFKNGISIFSNNQTNIDYLLNININFGSVTSFASSSDITITNQDGYPSGNRTSYYFDSDGILYGCYDNGQKQIITQCAIAIFENESGLLKINDYDFIPTVSVGNIEITIPNTSSSGNILQGYLEKNE